MRDWGGFGVVVVFVLGVVICLLVCVLYWFVDCGFVRLMCVVLFGFCGWFWWWGGGLGL